MLVHRVATAAIAALTFAAMSIPSRAENIDISSFSCGEFNEAINSTDHESQLGAAGIIYWLHGYLGTEEQGSLLDTKSFDKSIESIQKDCSASPQIGVMTVARRYMGENEGKPGKDALDVSVMKCEYVVKSSESDLDGLTQILLWIAGYNASSGDNTIINLNEFGKAAEKIGEYCAGNGQVSFMTANSKFFGEEETEDSDTSEN